MSAARRWIDFGLAHWRWLLPAGLSACLLGVFLQITGDHAVDVAIPDQKYSFGIVINAQAAGDLAVLESRGRRALRVHLGKDVDAGLQRLVAAAQSALA